MSHRFATSAVALVLAFGSLPALACLDVDAPPDATVRFLSPTSAEIIVNGLVVKAAGLTGVDNCAAGLGHTGTVFTGVTALGVVDAADDPPTPVVELAFAPNATTTGDLAALVPTSTWQGFSSAVSGPLAGGAPADLAFTVTFAPGTTFTDIEDELANDGLVASDDANGTGNLAGTTQNVEALTSIIELADCYNDVIDSGEVCDALDNLGCNPGDVCAGCTACVLANPANKCKGTTLKQIGNTVKSRLKCYAFGAKTGQTAPPGCLLPYQDLITFFWMKLNASPTSCPLFNSFPASTAIDGDINGLSTNLATALPLGGSTGAWKCANAKFKAASLRAVNTLKCWTKAYYHNTTVNPVCLSKVDLKFNQAFTRAENPGLCDPGNVGNAATVAALVDAFVTDGMNGVVDSIPPP